MAANSSQSSPKAPAKPDAKAARAERQAEALRANLHRRKDQARRRAAQDVDGDAGAASNAHAAGKDAQ